ncbi:hypothetical protein LN042_28340 [Kitasatospora sp. RB6PN24]|uniref:hypothetical protein n=1 Tax=Kitasatospora humi TaxID=2893891 RepID=UPI001E42EA72|nr:hypothetical protein [Kitasatospora humi]MCC9310933.1 hypothetical protein [Kitasatospora humi]
MPAEALHHWIVVVDIEGFSSRPNPIQASLRAALYQVVEESLDRAGVPAEGVVSEDRGDGVLLLVPAGVSPVLLVGPLIRALDDGLRQKAAVHSAAHALRLRVSLHQGLAGQDDRGWSGDAVNTAFRLVDADPVKAALAAATGANLVFVVSQEVYQGVVRHAYQSVDAAAYLPVRLTVKHGVVLDAWITVPGYPAPPGVTAAPTEPEPQPDPEPAVRPGPSAAGGRRRPAASVLFEFHGDVHGDQIAGDKYQYGSAQDVEQR